MERGTWIEPQPMATTSLRLPADVISQLKRQAQARHIRSGLPSQPGPATCASRSS
jgi:hypothetical protein